ncbi:MAG: demethylmenaquinone methyltransferase / 2-methoxy-6-polyprenyl,4-benzoquinol methylase [Chloroflexota bacterium]|nr:demethylmenaquinone methyltransferase / 2-methoxy-6-polyprenyl,4-benzoquinol methylase [Chloroflexota bacterium]
MFTAIAGSYDLMNRLMTFGRDAVWRRTVVKLCTLPPGGRLLDVATGTGDIAYEALRVDSTARPVGLDLTRQMMRIGQGKQAGLTVPFVEGDALALPFDAGVFDAACSGFMMRNVVDIAAAFREQARVVKPGGRVVCLELTLPRTPIFGQLFRFYFFRLVPLIGGLVSGQRDAYRYLPESVAVFPPPAELARTMASAGLRDVRYRLAMLGTVAIHWGTK